MPGRALPRYVRPARAMRMQVKKGDSVAVRRKMRQRAPLHLEVVEGFAAFEGSRGGITVTRRTSARRAAAPLSSGALLVVSSALALVVTRATAPLGIQRLFRVISKLPTLPRRGAFSTAA